MNTGITTETMLGTTRFKMRLLVVTLSAIHSMMVVTSPMGLHAPPLLAATTITPANNHRSFWSLSKRRVIITMMMVVVMLSSTALMMNESEASIHMSCFLLPALMCSVMKLNPPYRSMCSTMVMAQMRNTTISQVSPKCSTKSM